MYMYMKSIMIDDAIIVNAMITFKLKLPNPIPCSCLWISHVGVSFSPLSPLPLSTDINLDDEGEEPSSKRLKTDETDFSVASLAKGELHEVCTT